MKDKKKVAAIAAVMAYYNAASAGAAAQEPDAGKAKAVRATAPAAPMNLWGLSGRQAHMQMRGLMQMKAFHGTKLR